jgi:endoglucanase
MARWFIIYLIAGVLVVAGAGAWYVLAHKGDRALIFSPTQVLGATWLHYKEQYLEQGSGRTLDKSRDNVTTSEGESYTMLRAVWQGDRATFDQSWGWTKDNLLHDDDWLFSWLFGQRDDGSYGVLAAQGGEHSASDADQDIALALVFAYARWQDPAYIGEARRILDDIWDKEVITVNGKPYLAANDLEKFSSSDSAIINPSYLAPYAYRVFALVDSAHPWGELVDTSYDVLSRSMDEPLGSVVSAGLPPDWVRINKTTGALLAPGGELQTSFGFDALRVPLRLALDYEWYADPRAKELLGKMSLLSGQWKSAGALAATYAHDGSIVQNFETPAMYGGTIGYFLFADPALAKDVYEKKLGFLYNSDTNDWKQRLSYYDDNLAWFGIGVYNHLLPNLVANLPAAAYLTPNTP